MTVRNVFACLVHERQECVIDLVRNLHYFDPSSVILLYNGGHEAGLLNHGLPIDRHGTVVHPRPRPLSWGRLHDFALDCMQFCLDHLAFDTLTIVDSDQLAMRRDYSPYLARYLDGQPEVGLLCNAPTPQPSTTQVGPAVAAFKEIDLWRPLLRRFPDGESKFVHWSFWPTTIFTAAAARDLTRLFAADDLLRHLMGCTKIWATEEVILPTLVALLGYRIVANPCSYDYVQYRVPYSIQQIDLAMKQSDVFWIHPVARNYDDRLRTHIRARFDQYARATKEEGSTMTADNNACSELLLTLPILTRMKRIEGWLEEDEADLLIAATAGVLKELPGPHAVVEVGSYCGRSTIVLASVLKASGVQGKVYAIDPHEGTVGALDQGIRRGPPTLERFTRNISGAGLSSMVEIIVKRSFEVAWEKPISLLLIDGLHDYANVARDFCHFESTVAPGGYIAFHDYADYYPGVKAFVNETLHSGRFRRIQCVRSLMVLQKQRAGDAPEDTISRAGPHWGHADVALQAPGTASTLRTECAMARPREPLVSCIMPTCNRRAFVPRAIEYFLRQDYPNCELLVLDDGTDAVADLIPPFPHIRYLRLEGKRTIGAKRNLACEHAHGEFVVHWDDDDWYPPWRVRGQLRALLDRSADLCGTSQAFYYEPATDRCWRYVYAAQGGAWVLGGSLAYRKSVWENGRFPDVQVGEDSLFVWGKAAAVICDLADPQLCVAIIHPANTCRKVISPPYWHPHPNAPIHDLLGEDLGFYRAVPGQIARRSPEVVEEAAVQPLVSCIMPTYNRRPFVRRAIQSFLDQEYPKKELLVVDDGTDAVADLAEHVRDVRYIRLHQRISTGAKRNLACQQARGDIIAHWDDDDWYAPERLSYQTSPIVAGEADMTGLENSYLLEVPTGQFWRTRRHLHQRMFAGNVHGRTLVYRKDLIAQGLRYPDVYLAEDAGLIHAALARRTRLTRLANTGVFVYVRHGFNTWQFEAGRFLDPTGWERIEPPSAFPADVLASYQAALSQQRTHRT